MKKTIMILPLMALMLSSANAHACNMVLDVSRTKAYLPEGYSDELVQKDMQEALDRAIKDITTMHPGVDPNLALTALDVFLEQNKQSIKKLDRYYDQFSISTFVAMMAAGVSSAAAEATTPAADEAKFYEEVKKQMKRPDIMRRGIAKVATNVGCPADPEGFADMVMVKYMALGGKSPLQ